MESYLVPDIDILCRRGNIVIRTVLEISQRVSPCQLRKPSARNCRLRRFPLKALPAAFNFTRGPPYWGVGIVNKPFLKEPCSAAPCFQLGPSRQLFAPVIKAPVATSVLFWTDQGDELPSPARVVDGSGTGFSVANLR